MRGRGWGGEKTREAGRYGQRERPLTGAGAGPTRWPGQHEGRASTRRGPEHRVDQNTGWARTQDGPARWVGTRGFDVRTLSPLRPCQWKDECGNLLSRFQDSFCVKKYSQPTPRMICGSWAA